MSLLQKSFIFVIFAFTALSCGSPIGEIGGNGSTDYFLEVVPKRTYYDLGNLFRRNEDLNVYIINHGVLQRIPDSAFDLHINDDPDGGGFGEPVWLRIEHLVNGTVGHVLDTKGRKLIRVDYEDLEPQYYSIEVKDPLDNPPDELDEDGSGIIIKWAQ